jgi:hypothetical protein
MSRCLCLPTKDVVTDMHAFRFHEIVCWDVSPFMVPSSSIGKPTHTWHLYHKLLDAKHEILKKDM